YGGGVHRGVDFAPRFWAFVCRRTAYDHLGGAVLDIILDQHIAWSPAWRHHSRDGAGYRCLLRRCSALRHNGCSGAWISFQRGRNTTRSASTTPNAFYDLGCDKRGLFDG